MILTAIFDGGILGFFAALIGLQILYFLIWAKDSLWAWVVFWLGGRKRFASWLFDYLRENGYPDPGTYERSADAYLSAVLENEKLSISVRLEVASELGSLRFLKSSAQVQQSIQITMAYEDALQQHKRAFPAGYAASPATLASVASRRCLGRVMRDVGQQSIA